MSDTAIIEDSPVVAEIDSTSPSPDTIAAKADVTHRDNWVLAIKKDGNEVCDAVYLSEEGGYGYRKRDSTNNIPHPWRWARTKDFEDHYDTHVVLPDSMINEIAELKIRLMRSRITLKAFYKAMGNKSRSRVSRTLLDQFFNITK